jgi:hypothetical protein
MTPQVDLSYLMPKYRFEDIKAVFQFGFEKESLWNDDPWWQILGLVEGFNENQQSTVAAGKWKVLDESMSAWHPQKTKMGGLPHILFIMRKPEPLGTEFKVVACPQTGLFLYLEIQRGKEDMQ